ncbi:hypothetical protein P43SY_009300 [Pythium insidiosum]|uniref:DUF7869 domain-containing protein n=1 Tax=Pythium insidiosum TaxID=114742 RepID=A0AAD5LZ93_PYTIN|nr:hypothetical protein P43SY_009300 [Pythium insidiosum]
MKHGDTTAIAELIGQHAMAAQMMRKEYKIDTAAVSENNLVITMDYAQNIALPHVTETPSQWYFLSLVSVSVFGIHNANLARQTNYIYTERKGGKGSNEVVSMLHKYIGCEPTHKVLTVYADNCGGQNKNNFVVKYLLLLAHTGLFEEVNYKFFIRGHTKNACDRGFGTMKKKLAREDCWTLAQLCEALGRASISTDTVSLEEVESPFFAYKDIFNELYKNLPAIQKYQLFRMTASNPGVVECRELPSSPAFSVDLRREYDGNEGLAFVEWIRIEDAPSVKASDQVHVLCVANHIAYMHPVNFGAWFNDAIIRTFCSRLTSYYAGSSYAGIVRAKSTSQRGAKRCIPDEIVTQVKAQVESEAVSFIVVNFSNTNWGCIIVKCGSKTIGIYDPLGKTCYQTPLEELSWELSCEGLEGYRVVALNSPVQFDGHSCGFFVCHKLWTQVNENVSDNQLLHGGIARRMAFLHFLLRDKKFEDNLFHMV